MFVFTNKLLFDQEVIDGKLIALRWIFAKMSGARNYMMLEQNANAKLEYLAFTSVRRISKWPESLPEKFKKVS